MAKYRCLKKAFVNNCMKEIGAVVDLPDNAKVSDTTFEKIESAKKKSPKPTRKPKADEGEDFLA